jgi:hypothetical protein
MKKITAPIPFAGSQLGETRHVCAFFNSDEEEYRTLLPFIREGFQSGHKAIHVVNPDQRAEHLRRLQETGIDPSLSQQTGQLEVRVNTEVYLPDGRFDGKRMITMFDKWASENSGGTYPLSRICCRMDWAAASKSRIDDVIEFESQVNEVWSRHEDAVICTYQLNKFSGDAIIDIMRTHPMVIIGGILHQNPFYIPPDEFLREFRHRKASRNTLSAGA